MTLFKIINFRILLMKFQNKRIKNKRLMQDPLYKLIKKIQKIKFSQVFKNVFIAIRKKKIVF